MLRIKNVLFVVYLMVTQIYAMENEEPPTLLVEEYRTELITFINNRSALKDITKKQNIIKTIQMVQEFGVPLSLCSICYHTDYINNKNTLEFREIDREFDIDFYHEIDVNDSFFDGACDYFLGEYRAQLRSFIRERFKIQLLNESENYFAKQAAILQVEQEAHKIMLDLLQQ